MINAAKADGKIDQEEIDNIVKRLGELDEDEKAYAFSVMGMRLDIHHKLGVPPIFA
jgi:uncharacterized membrane protein YebE (DUF533 family)